MLQAPIPILHYALPKILSQALAEQKHAQAAFVFLTEPGTEPIRLLLLGVAAEVPEKLAVWRTAGIRAPALLVGTATEAWPVTESLALPVKLGRLLERMEYYAQLAVGQGPSVVACGAYELDLAAKKLRTGTAEQLLTDKECALLALFAADLTRCWSREELLRDVWGYDAAIDTHTLETHIYRLRRKLAELGGGGGGAADGMLDIVSGAEGYRMEPP
jgi:hypothetical protein